jgi:hypothetical protein
VEGTKVDIPQAEIAAFCKKWRIVQFSLFGSVLTDAFRPDSDVDVLVQFEPDHPWSLFDHVRMQDELAHIFGRKVDLVSRKAIEGSAKRRHREILRTAKVVYEAA